MLAALPKPLEPFDNERAATRLYRWAVQVDEYLRRSPRVETHVREIDPADLPVTLETRLLAPIGIARLRTVNTATGALVSDVSIAAQASTDPNQPGFEVSAMGGLSNGTVYECTLAVIGS